VFAEARIIYFSPFYFKNGNTPKNKYFVVLRNLDDTIILASLPTRSNKVPSFVNQTHGCINLDEHCFNCYLFEPGKVICENGFSFDLHTFIYGNEVEDYEVAKLASRYGIEGVDFEIAGTLAPSEYNALMRFLTESRSIKRRIKNLLIS
jgi:hypothetical protein